MKCNKCDSDNTQTLEVVFQGGTQNIQASSTTVGGFGSTSFGLGGVVTSTSGTSQTMLAQKAAPPRKASLILPVLGAVIGFFWLSSPSLYVFALLLISSGGYFGYKAVQFNSKKWPKLHQHWKESWMCNKCGNVYHSP
jgi:hypothetical protein